MGNGEFVLVIVAALGLATVIYVIAAKLSENSTRWDEEE